MAPPRSPEPAAGGARRDQGASVDEYDALVEEIAELQGLINVAEGRLVTATVRATEIGVSGGDNLSVAKWLQWRAGVGPARAANLVRLAERADELPITVGALQAGELSLDQAAEVARYVPARYDESAARVAQCCTVKQLRQALPWYRDPKPTPKGPTPDPSLDEGRTVSTGVDEQGWWIRGRLPEAEGAVVDQALASMREDLRRQAKAEAPEGTAPEPVSAADALVALAEAALRQGEAVRPGSDRYLVHAHLEAGPDGIHLMTHLGIVLPDGQRRHVLCDAKLRGIVHDGIAPMGAGRVTRAISRRMRRAVEHRDGGCAVPGCGRTSGLEVHHIWHWEDGGPTETWNLLTLCRHHHTCHHQGTLGIEGNGDLPRHIAPGVVFTNAWGRPLDPVGHPVRPASSASGAAPSDVPAAAAGLGIHPHRYVPPTGERLDPSGFHLQEQIPAPPADGEPPAPEDPPPPQITGRRPSAAAPSPASPTGGAPIDPTRAGPTAA